MVKSYPTDSSSSPHIRVITGLPELLRYFSGISVDKDLFLSLDDWGGWSSIRAKSLSKATRWVSNQSKCFPSQ